MFNIIKGHINELLKKQQDLYKERIKICNECPLKTKTSLGVVCDNKKCIENDSIYSNKNKSPNAICGCGCRLEAKLRLEDETCVLKKW